MKSPQLEDGYVKIANELYDALCRTRIPGEARQILDVIFRATYGWHRKAAYISLSEFAVKTGMGRRNVARAIKVLESMNLISVERGPGIVAKTTLYSVKNDTTQAPKTSPPSTSRYRINKDYDFWRIVAKKTLPHSGENDTVQCQNLSKGSGENATTIIKDKIKYKRTPLPPFQGECLSNLKTTPKKRTSELSPDQQKSFARFWSVWPKRVAMVDAEKAWAKIDISNGILEEICNAVTRWSQTDNWKKENGKYIPYPATWLNAKRWRDEIKAVNSQPEYSSPIITDGDNSIFADPEKI